MKTEEEKEREPKAEPEKIYTEDDSQQMFDIISRVDAGYTHDALFALGRRLKELESRLDVIERNHG